MSATSQASFSPSKKKYFCSPKFFDCDDVPRQTTCSDMPELVSVTENSFSN